MEKTNEEKQVLELKLIKTAKEIAALNDFPRLPQNAELENKLAAHTPEWHSLWRQACALVFQYASLLQYDFEAYESLQFNNQSESAKFMNRVQQLVGFSGMEIIKCATRRFSSEELTKGNDYIEENFIKKLTIDLQLTIKNYAKEIAAEEKNKGISFASEKEFKHLEINKITEEDKISVYRYKCFKNDFLAAKGKFFSEDQIMDYYLMTSNPYQWNINPEKLKQKFKDSIKMYSSTNVVRDSVEKDDEMVNIIDLIADERDEEYKETLEQIQTNKENYENVLSALQEFFEEKQKRKNSDTKYWQALITQFLLKNMNITKNSCDFQKYYDNLSAFYRKYTDVEKNKSSFIHMSVLNDLKNTGELCTRNDIIERFGNGKDKGQASRNIKEIIENLKNKEIFEK